jgi:hypothetical protein
MTGCRIDSQIVAGDRAGNGHRVEAAKNKVCNDRNFVVMIVTQ